MNEIETGGPAFDLAPVFQSVQQVMEANRLAFNQADSVNGNHGDHMVEIFDVAVQAARAKQGEGMAAGMDYAGVLLRNLVDNGSAQVYACGLAQLGEQLRKADVSEVELIPYLRKALQEDPPGGPGGTITQPARSGDVLKALVAALAGWQQAVEAGDCRGEVNGETPPVRKPSVDLGYMFDLGIAYMKAKQRNNTRAEVIADGAASVSPLGKMPWRYESGKLAILTLLRALTAEVDSLN